MTQPLTVPITTPTAKIIADSVNGKGDRLTTMEVEMHRFVLAEFNTHQVFSRSSASSRAIPVHKRLDVVDRNPAWPVVWAAEQPGMQGGDELEGEHLKEAVALFQEVHSNTVDSIASYLAKVPQEHRLHKSLVNRLLEPFMWHKVIVASTEWANFFNQRCSPLAQPEIRAAAEEMRAAYYDSTPVKMTGVDWHLPYITPEEMDNWEPSSRLRVSVARCARVSYLNHDGEYDPEADEKLFSRLVTADPPHWAPLEMVARPFTWGDPPEGKLGNFSGWAQLRHLKGTIRTISTEEGE